MAVMVWSPIMIVEGAATTTGTPLITVEVDVPSEIPVHVSEFPLLHLLEVLSEELPSEGPPEPLMILPMPIIGG